MVHTIHLSLVLFSVIRGKLSVCTPDRRLPSRPLAHGEQLDDALPVLVSAALKGKRDMYIEQLYTTADPVERGSIVIVYFVLLAQQNLPDHVEKYMRPVTALSRSFLEKTILSYAIQRLRWKIEYTNVVYALLPGEFTLSEMQNVYEAILGKRLDKRNFRKKILTLGMLAPTGKKRKQGVARPDSAKATTGRPAETYAFRKRSLEYVNVL